MERSYIFLDVNSIKKGHKYIELSGVVFGFIVSFVMILYSSCLLINKNVVDDNISRALEKRYIRLTDSYDSREEDIFSFFNKSNSLDIMKNTYNILKKDINFDYYNINNQSLQLIGDYYKIIGNDSKFVEDEGENINQQCEEDIYITSLRTIEIDSKIIKEFNKDKDLISGKFFDEDIKLRNDNILPVVLGNEYKDIFKIGDTFETYILGGEKNYL